MLFTDSVPKEALELLNRLMKLDAMHPFALGGGTALALRFGHRVSYDIDLFTSMGFDAQALAESIQQSEPISQLRIQPNTINARVAGVKLDCIAHRYNQLGAIEVIDGIRLYSLPDCVAMKLSAVGGRGARKDFYDIAALMQVMTLPEMVACFEKKYPNADSLHTILSLTYFDDANLEEEVTLCTTSPAQLQSWQAVQSLLVREVKKL